MAKKGKKEKVKYYDDGRTLADMSNVSGSRLGGSSSRPPVKFKDAWKTYWNAVRQMVGPMLIVMAGIGVVYLVIWLIFFLMY